jgi:hypothetical protein
MDSEHVMVSRKCNVRWDTQLSEGRGGFKYVVFLLNKCKNRVSSTEYRNVVRNEILITFLY